MSDSVAGTTCFDQLARVERFLSRVQDHNRASVEYDDDLWSFFQNAWHLKDWIENDGTLDKNIRKAIVDEAHRTFELQVCADIAVGTKHLSLTKRKNRGYGYESNVDRRSVNVYLGSPTTSVSTHYISLNDGSTIVAQELAEGIVTIWRKILSPIAHHAM